MPEITDRSPTRFDNIDAESDLYNLLPNPDKLDENDPDFMLNNVISNYHSAQNLNTFVEQQSENKTFSLFHCNVRSLSKKGHLLHELLSLLSKSPDVLAVTETKLNETNITNIDIAGYNFFHTDSKMAAGGAGIYIFAKHCKVNSRKDLEINQELVESCWIEVDTPIRRKKPIVIGCIYRHPKSNFEQFAENLEEILRNLNQDKRLVYILGDTNIDF